MSDTLVFQSDREPGWIGNSGGPFYWWGKCRFPIVIEEEFKYARVNRAQSLVNGYRTEVEIYTQKTDDVRSLDIHYDPSIGYLPRYPRVCGPANRTTHGVKEMYMLDARPCAAGGFVPFEWYSVSYYVDNFPRRFPAYDHNTVLKPSYHLVGIGHYKALRMTDRKKTVTLEKLTGITRIATNEGAVSLRSIPDRMGLDEVESRLQSVFAHPKHPPPAVDTDELRRFMKPPVRNTGWYSVLVGGLVFTMILAGFLVLRHRGLFFLLILVLPISPGCGGSPSSSAPQLAAEVSPSLIIYELNKSLLDVTLLVTNKSTQNVKLFQASGGCSCRKIDQRCLPADLKPGQGVALPIRLADDGSYDPRGFVLALLTDHGPRERLVKYVALPRHRLSPGSINLGTLIDGQEEKEVYFDLVHREVFERGKPHAETSLQVPPQFSMESTGSHETDLLEDRGLVYVDKSYRLTLRNKDYGLNKSVVRLNGLTDRGIVESAIIWQCLPVSLVDTREAPHWDSPASRLPPLSG